MGSRLLDLKGKSLRMNWDSRRDRMKKETEIQVNSELAVVESEIRKMEYHLVGLNNEKRKTKLSLEVLKKQKEKLKSYL